MSNKIDNGKIRLAIFIVAISAVSAYFCQPVIHGNQDAINVIVTVFAILAGFLVAVITIVGDPKSLPLGGWQVAQLGSDLTNKRLIRYKWLFKAYLMTLFLIFISILIKDKYPKVLVYLEYIYIFIATVACILSYKLPNSLMEYQQEAIENEISERRKKEGIKDNK